MMKALLSATLLATCACIIFASPASAQVGKGLKGPHYNLNIIGVPHDKSADMTGSHGHTLFVPLDTQGRVENRVKIYFVAGDQFRVLDRNATDGSATVEVPHGDPGTVCYFAYATALGTPHGSAHVDAEVFFDETDHEVLLALDQVEFDAYRGKGKPVRMNISDIFRVSGCLDLNDSGACDAGDEFFNNEWVFNVDELLEYLWGYTNNGLRLLQVRFYDCYGHMAEDGSSPAQMQRTIEEATSWGCVKALYR